MYKYYLFGGVVIEYYRKGVHHLMYKIYTDKEQVKFDLCKYKLGDDPKILLNLLSKWFNYLEISKDEYEFLIANKKDYDEME